MNHGNIDLKASEELPIKGVGTFIYIVNADSPVKVKGKGINVILKAGQGVQTNQQFSNVEIFNTVAALNSVDYVIGNGEFFNAELSGDVNATIKQGATITQAPVSVGIAEIEISAADSAAKYLMIQNKGTSSIFVGGSGVTAANGIEVASNATLIIDHAAAAQWKAISTVADQDVRILKAV